MDESPSSYFYSNKIPFTKKREGVYVKVITGVKSQLCIITLSPETVINHAHVEEQMGYIVSGKVSLSIGNETKDLGPGDAYYIPSNVHHAFHVRDAKDVEYIEVFSPPKN